MKSKTEIQKEIVEGLQEPSHGLLRLAPRVGKTKIGIDIIKKEKPKRILWVTPNAKLRDVDIPTEFKIWKNWLTLSVSLFPEIEFCFTNATRAKREADERSPGSPRPPMPRLYVERSSWLENVLAGCFGDRCR